MATVRNAFLRTQSVKYQFIFTFSEFGEPMLRHRPVFAG